METDFKAEQEYVKLKKTAIMLANFYDALRKVGFSSEETMRLICAIYHGAGR